MQLELNFQVPDWKVPDISILRLLVEAIVKLFFGAVDACRSKSTHASATSARRGALGSLATNASGVQTPASRSPRAMVVAMVPAPMKPMVPISLIAAA